MHRCIDADGMLDAQHAHLVSIALLVFAFTAPLVMVSWTSSVWAAVLMDFLAVMVYFALNEARFLAGHLRCFLSSDAYIPVTRADCQGPRGPVCGCACC